VFLELYREARPFGLHEYPLKTYSKIPRKVFHANLLFFSSKDIIPKGNKNLSFCFLFNLFTEVRSQSQYLVVVALPCLDLNDIYLFTLLVFHVYSESCRKC
jgi:hypothetical protein